MIFYKLSYYLFYNFMEISMIINLMYRRYGRDLILFIHYITKYSLSPLLTNGTKYFTSNFMPTVYNNIKHAYYGGRVDVFKPFGNNLYYYDVNSLYLSAMLNVMPVGEPVLTNNTDLDKLFGYVYVDIITPEFMKYRLLPHKCEDGTLINPLGKWSG